MNLDSERVLNYWFDAVIFNKICANLPRFELHNPVDGYDYFVKYYEKILVLGSTLVVDSFIKLWIEMDVNMKINDLIFTQTIPPNRSTR